MFKSPKEYLPFEGDLKVERVYNDTIKFYIAKGTEDVPSGEKDYPVLYGIRPFVSMADRLMEALRLKKRYIRRYWLKTGVFEVFRLKGMKDRRRSNDVYVYAGTRQDAIMAGLFLSEFATQVKSLPCKVYEVDLMELLNSAEIHYIDTAGRHIPEIKDAVACVMYYSEAGRKIYGKYSFVEDSNTRDYVSDMLSGVFSSAIDWLMYDDVKRFVDTLTHVSQKKINEEFVVEASLFTADDDIEAGGDIPTPKSVAEDVIRRDLRAYIEGKAGSERVFLLLGETAVGKSAMVKSIAEELGYRLVDIRSSFLERLDIEGYVKIQNTRHGLLAESAPPQFLYEASDEFIMSCRDAVKLLKEQFGENPEGSQKEILEKFEYYSKPAILFFDEITRTIVPVMNAFVQILNQKTYNGFHFSMSKIVCASNLSMAAASGGADEIYLVSDMMDKGIEERFRPYYVDPQTVNPTWFNYIQNEFHPLVVKFIKEDVNGRAYRIDFAKDIYAEFMDNPDQAAVNLEARGIEVNTLKGLNNDSVDFGLLPFPNYRTWEFVSNYLRMYDEDHVKYIDEDVIYSYLGKNPVSTDFVAYIKAELGEDAFDLTKEEDETVQVDNLYRMARGAIAAGQPIMLIGMTSLGKTTRVKEIAKALDANIYIINLAQKERVDVGGAPYYVPITDAILSDYAAGLDEETKRKLSDVFSNNSGVTHITKSIPRKGLKEALDKAKEEKKRLVLFFDEYNRADKFTRVSVFEAVSDNRFGGVEFYWMCINKGCGWIGPKKELKNGKCPKCGRNVISQVTVVAACNYGSEYAGAGELDPAMAARFAIVTKFKMDKEDVNAVLRYMEKNGYASQILSYFKTLGSANEEEIDYEALIEMFESVEGRELAKAAPSLRAWSDLNAIIKDSYKYNYVLGKTLEVTEAGELEGKIRQAMSSVPADCNDEEIQQVYSEALAVLKSIPRNYAGFKLDKKSYYIVAPHPNTGDTLKLSVKDAYDTAVDIFNALIEGKIAKWDEKSCDVKKNFINVWLNVIINILAANNAVIDTRTELFKSILGPETARSYVDFHNKVTGTEDITIADVVDRQTAEMYIDQHILGSEAGKTEADRLTGFVEFYRQFLDHWENREKKDLTKDQVNGVAEAVWSRANRDIELLHATIAGLYKQYFGNFHWLDLNYVKLWGEDGEPEYMDTMGFQIPKEAEEAWLEARAQAEEGEKNTE